MEYPGNSFKDRENNEKPPKKIEKVVVSEVIQRDKGVGSKFKNVFLGDGLHATTYFVAQEVFWPTVRSLLLDIIIEGSRNVILGRAAYRQRFPTERHSRISYDNPTRPTPDFRDARDWRDARPRVNVADRSFFDRQERARSQDSKEIILGSASEAEAVLERMIDIINQYESVSLADYYDLLGLPASPVDNKWGWTYLHNAKVRQVRDGFIIDLPRMEAF